MLCGIRARTPIQTSRTIGGSPPSHSPVNWDGTTSSGEVWLVIRTGISVSLSARKGFSFTIYIFFDQAPMSFFIHNIRIKTATTDFYVARIKIFYTLMLPLLSQKMLLSEIMLGNLARLRCEISPSL
jgi:hypothetical protein